MRPGVMKNHFDDRVAGNRQPKRPKVDDGRPFFFRFRIGVYMLICFGLLIYFLLIFFQSLLQMGFLFRIFV